MCTLYLPKHRVIHVLWKVADAAVLLHCDPFALCPVFPQHKGLVILPALAFLAWSSRLLSPDFCFLCSHFSLCDFAHLPRLMTMLCTLRNSEYTANYVQE